MKTSEPFAVIDVGTTSVRMVIAAADSNGSINLLDFLHQSLSLGKDTFSAGKIAKSSIEECVNAIRSFKKAMLEYQITDEKQIKAVATTAVREASNIDAFIDRISIATGINIEPLDETEVARLTYMSFRAAQKLCPELNKPNVVILEAGGGSTELLYIVNGLVAYNNTYKVGTMRMREMFKEFQTSSKPYIKILQSYVDQTVNNIRKSFVINKKPVLIALGSEMKLAAANIANCVSTQNTIAVPVKELTSFAVNLLGLSPNEIVRKYSVSFPDAETVGQALLIYASLAKSLGVKEIKIAEASMVNGLLLEFAGYNQWSEDFRKHVISSALEIARRYKADESHALHVSNLCYEIFDALSHEHMLNNQWRHLLAVSALLHDIGAFVSNRSHHKHSMYLIRNSELFGLSRKDLELVSLIARYHRRSQPGSDHVEFNVLPRAERQAVMKAASILRVADALDRSFCQRIRNISCAVENRMFIISVPIDDDLSIEQLALKNKGTMFEDVYGLTVVLRSAV